MVDSVFFYVKDIRVRVVQWRDQKRLVKFGFNQNSTWLCPQTFLSVTSDNTHLQFGPCHHRQTHKNDFFGITQILEGDFREKNQCSLQHKQIASCYKILFVISFITFSFIHCRRKKYREKCFEYKIYHDTKTIC